MRKRLNPTILWVGLSPCCPAFLAAGDPAALPAPRVIFICEHGSAKSVIAAAYFNRIAEQRGLPYRAISRGITPDSALQPATREGLSRDGLEAKGFAPTRITPEAAATALRVVTIGLERRPGYLDPRTSRSWDQVPAVSEGYDRARNDLLKRVQALILELETAKH